MRCFEVTLRGFTPDSTKTDHLIKWVLAPNLEVLSSWLDSANLKESTQEIRDLGDRAKLYDWDDGVDIKLDEFASAVYC